MDHQSAITRINIGGQTFVVPVSAIDEQADENQYPQSWPCILKRVGHYDLKAKEWMIGVAYDPHNCIAILPIKQVDNSVHGKSVKDYRWTIKPLARGTAQIKVQCVLKASGQIEEEQTYTIIVS